MNVVDSCGWLEYFADGSNAGFFSDPIEDTDHLVVPTVCVLEVFKHVFRLRGEGAALQAIALMHQAVVAEMDTAIALNAAKLGLQHDLPLADSIVLATARSRKATVWTQDIDFKGLEGVMYIRI